jgi:hypothetical protein
MITWRKLMGSGQMILPNMIFLAAIRNCNDVQCPAPAIYSINPAIVSQGTDIAITITGVNIAPRCGPLVQGPAISGDQYGVTADYPPIRWDDTSATFNLHIAPNALTGKHWIAVDNGAEVSDPKSFTVTCPGCPSPPELLSIVNYDYVPLVPGGTVTFELVGTNFLNNNNLQVQIDGSGVSFPPGPYNVQPGDYFLLPITADANATPGDHKLWVTGDGGRSLPMNITVDASQPPPSPSPGSTPFLMRITPTHVTKDDGQVSIKLEGTGFGTRHSIIVDNYVIGFQGEGTYQAYPDFVAVGSSTPIWSSIPETQVTVRIHNIDNNTTSDGLPLFLDELDPNKPYVTTVSGVLQQGSDADVVIGGYNLLGVTEQTIFGIPGLTFSNVQPDPNFPNNVFYVHIHSGLTPVTGDDATNLIITTPNGQSPLTFFRVFPPLPTPTPTP